jgi:hypothetical protein
MCHDFSTTLPVVNDANSYMYYIVLLHLFEWSFSALVDRIKFILWKWFLSQHFGHACFYYDRKIESIICDSVRDLSGGVSIGALWCWVFFICSSYTWLGLGYASISKVDWVWVVLLFLVVVFFFLFWLCFYHLEYIL